MLEMQLTKGIPVRIGKINAKVFGGPFKQHTLTRRLVSVKMAAEIDQPHDIGIPTIDFNVPPVLDMQRGLIEAFGAMIDGNDIYVGCMGGIGRTGLFMGCVAKVMKDLYDKPSGIGFVYHVADPVDFVRKNYIGHAIETAQQQDYVRNFDTQPVIDWLKQHLIPKVVTVEKPVEVEVYPSLFDYAAWWMSGGWLK